MIKETVIPEPTKEEVWRVYKQKIEQNQITVAIAAAFLQSFWYICDYILMPDERLHLFLGRIAVLLIPITVCIFRKPLRISPSACLFFSGTLTALMISVVMCSAPESAFQIYVVGYCLLFLAAGALANLEQIHSILFPLLSLVFNFVLFYLWSPLEFGRFLTGAIVPIYSCATIGYLMIEGRKTMQLKEISSRMEIDRSRKIIEAQKNKLNEELDNFVYSVSHDLRSPLLSVKGILSLILSTEKMNEGAEKYMRMAQGSIDRLDNTIQDILEYSRNSRLDVKMDYFDIRPVVQNIFDDIQFVSDNPMRFEIDIDGDPVVYTDQTRVSTIIKNLASNAAKYRKLNHDQCLIRFELKQNDTSISIKVIDNGIGIPEGEKEKVFQMFYRVSTDRMGTGLGLFIVQEITGKLKGKINLESKEDFGTSIEITLPIQKESLQFVATT
jgi:signal transduction histidine kinase